MKKYIKIIFYCLSISIFSINAQSIELEDQTIKSTECHTKLVGLLRNMDKPKNTNEEGAANKIVENILGDDKAKVSQRLDNISELSSCFQTIVESDLSLKILRMLYGEVINIPVGITSYQFLSFFKIKAQFDENKFNENTDILSYLPSIISSFNYIVFSFAVIFVTLIYSSKFFKMMSKKGQNTSQYFSKNSLRVLLGLASILPLAFINNFTFIQFVFLCLLVVGVIMAKILWMFMLLSLNYTYLDTDIMNKLESSDINTSFLNQVHNNINIHFCDFKKRNYFLGEEVLSDSYEDLISSEYYNCLITPEKYNFEFKDDLDIKIPKDIKIGEFCAKKFQKIEENENYCGQIFVKKETNTKNEMIVKIRNSVLNNLNINGNAYQSTIRNLAYSYYKYECRLEGGSQEEESKKPFKCPKTKSDGSIEYNSALNKVLFENERFNSQKEIDSFIQSEFPIKYIEIGKNFENLKETLKKEEILKDEEFSKITDSLLQSYTKGFLMAGNVFYERAQISAHLENSLESLKDIYIVEDTGEFDLPNIGSVNTANIYVKVKKQGENSFLIPLSEVLDSKENSNCALNYSDCYMSSINPFTKLMDNGNKMLSFGILGVVSINALKYSYISENLKFIIDNRHLSKRDRALEKRKIDSTRSSSYKNMEEYLDFLASIIYIYVFIGVFFAFILPFIPFFIFASLVFSWFLQTFKIMLLSGLLSIYMLVPNERDDNFTGKEEKIYKLFIKTALTPVLILCGFLITIVLANLGISILNIWFAIIIDYFSLKGNPENLMDYINSFIALGIYLFMVTKIVIKASESISEFPVAVSKWLDIDIEDERIFNKIKGIFESYVVPSISKFMK